MRGSDGRQFMPGLIRLQCHRRVNILSRLRASACIIRFVAVFLAVGVAPPVATGLNSEDVSEAHARIFSSTGPGIRGDVQTAGAAALFTITAHDARGIRATSGGDEFIVQAEGPSSVRGTVLDQLDGSYEAAYTVTRSGDYELTITPIQQGGLLAEYFENVWLFYAPVKRLIEPSVDHSWGLEKITDTASDYISVRWTGFLRPTYSETVTFYLEVDHGARLLVDGVTLIDCWSDYSQGGKNYYGSGPNRRQCVSGASMSVTAGSFYHIRLDYRHLQEDAFAKLLWLSPSITPKQVVTQESLFFPAHSSSKSSYSFALVPADPMGSTSEAHGDFLSISTAGQRARFVINARDAYGNERSSDHPINGVSLAVRVEDGTASSHIPHVSQAAISSAAHDQRPAHGMTRQRHDGLYDAEVTPQTASPPARASCSSHNSRLLIDLLHPRGVSATYYAGTNLDEPLSSTANTAATSSSSFTSSPFRVPQVSAQEETDALERHNGTYVVRWSGFLKPEDAATYSFSVTVNGSSHNFSTTSPSGKGVRIWIDRMLVIDQLSTGSQNNSAITLGSTDAAYPIDVLLRDTASQTAAPASPSSLRLLLKWNKTSSSDASCQISAETPSCPVPTTAVFAGEPIADSPYALLVKPAPVRAARSSVSYLQGVESQLRGLSIATAGLASEFYVTARDEYGNRVWAEDAGGAGKQLSTMGLKVRLSGVDSAMGYVTPALSRNSGDDGGKGGVGTGLLDPGAANAEPCSKGADVAGVFKVRFTTTKSGTYDINVAFGASLVAGSPFRISVQPARRHLSSSSLSGAGLTLATAGVVSYLTLTVRDAHHNWQPDPRIANAGLGISLLNEEGRAVPTKAHPFAPGDMPSYHRWSSGGSSEELVAAPTSLDNPTLRLNYMVTRSGRYTLRVSGSGTHEGELVGEPLALRVAPQQHCACKSTVAVSELSVSTSQAGVLPAATAGVPVSISIISRDEYSNVISFETVPSAVPADGGGEVGARAPLYSTMLRTRVASSLAASNGCTAAVSQAEESCTNTIFDADGDDHVPDQSREDNLVRVEAGEVRASVIGTRAGANTAIWARLAQVGGLRASFYNGITGFSSLGNSSSVCPASQVVPFLERTDPKVEAAWADVLAANTSTLRGFSARWEGLVRPSVSGVYTFDMGRTAGVYGGERLRLWIDNSLIIDQWTSLANFTGESLHGSAVQMPTLSGTAALTANTYHDIRIAWKEDLQGMKAAHANTSVRLFWKVPSCLGSAANLRNCSNHSSAVPSAMLYSALHLQNSPIRLKISASRLCASLSSLHGTALTLATAGVAASFLMHTRDSFGNLRNEEGGPEVRILAFDVVPHGTLPANAFLQPDETPHGWNATSYYRRPLAGGARSSGSGSVVGTSSTYYEGKGQYKVSYLVTTSGSYQMRGRLLSAGGLYGTYFENSDLTDHGVLPDGSAASLLPSFVRLDREIDFNWRKSERPCGLPSKIRKDIGPDFFSVRWKGFVLPPHTGSWTFHASLPATNDVKLYVNGLRILATSTTSSVGGSTIRGATSVAGTVALMANVPYPITLEYRRYTASGRLLLQWQHGLLNTTESHIRILPVPSSRLLTWTMPPSLCASHERLLVNSGHACASRSSAAGALLSLATAGARIAFVITSRDHFSNLRPGPDGGVGAKEWTRLPVRHAAASLHSVASSREVTLANTAPQKAALFKGMIIRLHEQQEQRRIASYSSARVAAVEPPFSRLPRLGERYSIVDNSTLSGQEQLDYHVGQPRFYAHFAPYPSPTTDSRDNTRRRTIHAITERMSSHLGSGGLSATYYALDGSMARAQPLWASECLASGVCERSIDFSVEGSSGDRRRRYDSVGYSLPSSAGYSVRWSGSLAVPRTGLYSFSAEGTAGSLSQDEVRLWIDGRQVLNTSTTNGSIYLNHTLPTTFPVAIEYTSKSADASGMRLLWKAPAHTTTLMSNASQTSSFQRVPSSALHPLSGRHGVGLVPQLAGYYRTHIGLARAGGLDATFYSDLDLEHGAAVAVSQTPEVDLGLGSLPAWVLDALGKDGEQSTGTWVRREMRDSLQSQVQWLSPHSFSVRWQGLLRVGEAAEPLSAHTSSQEAVFTFEAVVAQESEERVKLWVDDDLLIDAGGSGSSVMPTPAGSVSLRGGYFYQIRLEYSHRTADRGAPSPESPPHARLELRWKSSQGASGVRQTCASEAFAPIPERCLFAARPILPQPSDAEHQDKALATLRILPAATCASGSVLEYPQVWRVRAGEAVSFSLRSHDAYGNPRNTGDDTWYVQAIPFPEWDVMEPLGTYSSSSSGRASRDCDLCSSVKARIELEGDETYVATLNASRAGTYKVVADLLLRNGLAATYYSMDSQSPTEPGLPAYQRAGQQLDSLTDFFSPCPVHTVPGLLPHQVPTHFDPAVSHSEDIRCTGWLSGKAASGSRRSILVDGQGWSQASLHAVRSDVSDWVVLVTQGPCKGQWRNVSGVTEVTSSSSSSTLNISVSREWSDVGGVASAATSRRAGPALPQAWFGCTSPDSNSHYALLPRSRAPGSLSGSGTFAARWAGFLQTASGFGSAAARACRYSFQVDMSRSEGNQERVKLWIDNSLLIDQWSSLKGFELKGTLLMSQDVLYKIHVLYKRAAVGGGEFGHARMLLRWSSSSSGDATVSCGSGSTSVQAIPRERLFAGFRVAQGDGDGILEVDASETDSTTSIAMGSGLTEATAGSAAAFVIRARDAVGNARHSHQDDWVVRLWKSSRDDPGQDGGEVHGSVDADRDALGSHEVVYTATIAGEYSMSIRRAVPGGLTATHFNNAHLMGDFAEVSVDPEIDFTWSTAQLAPAASLNTQAGSVDEYLVSIRWTGWFKAELSETYTLWVVAPQRDSLRLFVNGRMQASRWHPLGASDSQNSAGLGTTAAGAHDDSPHGESPTDAEISASVSCAAGQLYEVTIEYRFEEGKRAVSFMYSSPSVVKQVVPSARLFKSAEHIFGSPFTLEVVGAATCAAASHTIGFGLSSTTAGTSSRFVIQSSDAFGNRRSSWSDTWVVYATPGPATPLDLSAADYTDPSATTSTRNLAAKVSPSTVKGRFNVEMLQTTAGTSALSIGLAVPGALSATYYDKSILSATRRQADSGTSETWSAVANRRSSLSVDSVVSGAFAVRWAGLLRPSITSAYTFFPASVGAQDERMRLWVDGLLLIDQWQSLSLNLGAQPSATVAFARADSFYELVLDYQTSNLTSRTALTAACALRAASPLPSSRLFVSEALKSGSGVLSVQPAPTDLATSRMLGDAVSCATAGILSRFTVACQDRYGNPRGESKCGSDFELRVFSASLVGDVHSTGKDLISEVRHKQEYSDGGQPLHYLLTVSGTYEMQLFMGSASKGATVHVYAGEACASSSLVQGHSVSIATAGYGASFTIQSRDAFGNARSLNDDAFRVLLRHLSHDERHDCRAVSMGRLPNTDLGRHSVSFRTTRSASFALDVRLVTGGKGHLNMTCISDALHLSRASLTHVSRAPGYGNSDQLSGDNTFYSSNCGALKSARWEGSVSSRYSETYTFEGQLGSEGERVRLWVEDRWVIDQWSSLSSLNPSGTIWMAKDVLVDMGLAYRQGPSSSPKGSSGVKLLWRSASEPSEAVPTDRLFSLGTHLSGSPFKVIVYPARTCGSVSTAVGPGLSLATAGFSAQMTILAKDHLGNPQSESLGAQHAQDAPEFVVYARREDRRDEGGTVSSVGLGRFEVAYKAHWKRNKWMHEADAVAAAGTLDQAFPPPPLHQVSAVLAEQGGIHATYYNAENFTRPSRSGVATVVSMSVRGSSPLSSGCVSSDSGFSARYRGMLRPPGQQRYTFTAPMSGPQTEERVRLWIDNVLLIDQWNSLSTAAPTAAIQLGEPGASRAHYDLRVDFKGRANASSLLPSNMSLNIAYHESPYGSAPPSMAAPEPVIVTNPHPIPSAFLAHSYPISVRTSAGAGLAATYYSGSATASSSACAPRSQCSSWGTPQKFAIDENLDWSSGPAHGGGPYAGSVAQRNAFAARWSGFISPPIQNVYTIQARLHGVHGTGERVSIWVDNQQVISQWSSLSSSAPSGTIRLDAGDKLYHIEIEYKTGSPADARGVSLEWGSRGRFADVRSRPDYTESEIELFHSEYDEFLFPAFDRNGAAGSNDAAVSMGVIASQYLHQPQAGALVERDDYEYWDTDTYDAAQPQLYNSQVRRRDVWSVTGGCPLEAGTLAHDRCRGRGIANNDHLRVVTNPGITCASKSSAFGVSLTVSTAGVTRTFTLTARDAWDNQRDALDDSFIATASLDLQHLPPYRSLQTEAQAQVSARFESQPYDLLLSEGEVQNPPADAAGKYEGAYTATVSGLYNMQVQAVDRLGNGLVAEYYPGSPSDHGRRMVRTDPNVDFNWGVGSPDVSVPEGTAMWSARWLGMVKAEASGEHTFYIETDGTAELTIAGRSIVSARDTGTAQVWSGTVDLVAGMLHDIGVEYLHASGPARMHLRWQIEGEAIQVVPTSSLFAGKELVRKGTTRLLVRAGAISAARSQISGIGISLSTAGVESTFVVTARDAYGNMRDDGEDMLLATVVPSDLPERAALQSIAVGGSATFASAQGATGSAGVHKSAATVYQSSSTAFADQSGNLHRFSYIVTRAGSSMLHAVASFPVLGASGAIRDVAVVLNGSGYTSSTAVLNVNCASPCTGAGLSGVCRVSNGAVFAVDILHHGSGYSSLHPPNISCAGGNIAAVLKLTVSEPSYLGAQGGGLHASYYDDPRSPGPAAASTADAVIDFSHARVLTPSQLENDGAFAVRWKGAIRALPTATGRLEEDIYTATLTAPDERLRLWLAHALIIDQWNSLETLRPSGGGGSPFTQAAASGERLLDIRVEYKKDPGASSGGAPVSYLGCGLTLSRRKQSISSTASAAAVIPRFHLFAVSPIATSSALPGHDHSGSWQIRVEPNVACATYSLMRGSGLSIATAGMTATFSIQSRDAYSNTRLAGSDRFIVKVLSDECQSPDKLTCRPYGPEQGVIARSTSAGTFLTSDLFAISIADQHCLLSDSLVKIPDDAAKTMSTYVGAYAIFVGGTCNGRWSTISSFNASGRCANISSQSGAWTDGLAGCSSSSGNFYLASPSSEAEAAYPPMSCPNCKASTSAQVTDKGGGLYLVSYRPTGRGAYSVFGSLSPGPGLTATYYSNASTVGTSVNIGLGEPVSTRSQAEGIDWSTTASRRTPVPSLPSTQGFGARWTGFISACLSQTYTFSLSLHEQNQRSSRVKLWIDNQLIIDQWSSLTYEEPTGKMPLAAFSYYDMSLLYKCPANLSSPEGHTCGHTLGWKSGDDMSSSPVPLSALHQGFQMDGKLGQLRVAGGAGCVSTSSASGLALTLATAGRSASFTITSRDAYGNPRDSVDSFSIQLIGTLDSPLYGGFAAELQPLQGTSLASYTAFQAKTYDLYVQQGNLGIQGSPFHLTVRPDSACGSTSTMSGNGLTAASLAPAVNTFQIQVRDAFGNQRPDVGVEGEAFFVRVVRTRSPNTQGSAHGGLPPFSSSKALSDPGDIPTLYASAPGDQSDLSLSYTIPVVPSPAGQAHWLFASWIQRGGLHATYYSSDSSAPTSELPRPCTRCAETHKFPATVSSGGLSTNPATFDSGLTGSASVCGSASCNFVIRWAGVIRACLSGADDSSCIGSPFYTRDFKWTIASADRVKLWVDNKLIIDQWTSLDVSSPSGSISFGKPDGLADIFAEYQRLATDVISSAPVLLSDTGQDGTFQAIHSMRLYRTESLRGSPSYLNVYPT